MGVAESGAAFFDFVRGRQLLDLLPRQREGEAHLCDFPLALALPFPPSLPTSSSPPYPLSLSLLGTRSSQARTPPASAHVLERVVTRGTTAATAVLASAGQPDERGALSLPSPDTRQAAARLTLLTLPAELEWRCCSAESHGQHNHPPAHRDQAIARRWDSSPGRVRGPLLAWRQLTPVCSAGLAKWSRGEVTDDAISGIYVKLGNDFNVACAAFAKENIGMRCVQPLKHPGREKSAGTTGSPWVLGPQ